MRGFGTAWPSCCVLACVLAAACTATPRPDASHGSAAFVGPLGAPGEPAVLCVAGRDVLRVPEPECERLQAEERTATTLAGRMLDRATLEYSPQQLDLQLLEGIVLGARYKYRVEASYRDSYFTRVDAYSFPLGADAGDLLDGLPLRIGLNRNSELIFAQQFASGQLARSPESTYLPNRLPLRAEKALALKVGDYVRFATRLSLLANAGQVWPLAGFLLNAQADFSVLLDGEYEVHVFRLDDSRIRLKLVAERGREIGASTSVSVSPIVAAALLDRASGELVPLSRLVDFDESAAIAASRSRSELFLVDYTLDLSQPEVAAAYEKVFEPELRVSDIRIANPLQGRFELRERLLSSIEDIDRLARRDVGRDAPAVVRHFHGSNLSTTRMGRFRLELKSFDVTRERVFRHNALTRRELTADGERLDFFLLPTWSQTRDRDMLFGMLNETQVRTADALFVADETGRPVRFMNIGFSLDYEDATLRSSEYRRLRRKLELLLPAQAKLELAALMAETGWLTEGPRRNLSVTLRYFFRQAAFDSLVAAGYGDRAVLETALAEFIVRGVEDGEFPLFRGTVADLAARYTGRPPAPDTTGLHARAAAAAAEIWRAEIERTVESLGTAFTAAGPTEERMQAVLDLRNDAFYRRVGTAFWIELLQRAGVDLSGVMFLSLELRADGHEGISFSFGEPDERELYESVKFIETVLNDRSLDMRELGELDTIISRMNVIMN